MRAFTTVAVLVGTVVLVSTATPAEKPKTDAAPKPLATRVKVMNQRYDGPLQASYRVDGRSVEYAASTHQGMPDGITKERVLLLPDLEMFCIVSGFGSAPGISACAAADPILKVLKAEARAHPGGLQRGRAREVLERSIQLGHQGLVKLGIAERFGGQSGATVVAVALSGDSAIVAHVGSERVYRLRQGKLEQVTEDHSLLSDYLKTKKIPPEQVREIKRSSPYKKVVVRALGVRQEVLVEVHEHTIERGDRLLVTTRNLEDALDEDEIACALSDGGSAAEVARRLMERAVAAQPFDDYAAVVIDAHTRAP